MSRTIIFLFVFLNKEFEEVSHLSFLIMATDNRILYKSVAIIVGVYLLFLCLINAKAFLVPVVLAVALTLLLVPVAKKT
jgi:hypothetical protein